jgi:DNA-binding IclR family transcriptional regulator
MEHKSGTGVQSIERTVAIVRAVAQAQREGARLVDVARQLAISKPTAHRILQALVQAGWITQEGERGRFHLGVELHALGLAAAPRHELVGLGQRAVTRLAEQVGDSAYFQLRTGIDSVCLARQEGSYPVKILTIDVGMRSPLGMGAGNLALLAFLPDDEVERVIGANIDELPSYAAPGVRIDAALLHDMVRQARFHGYAFVQDLFIPGMGAVGMPITGADGTPVGALSVAAITARLREERRVEVVAALRREVTIIEGRLKKISNPLPGVPLTTLAGAKGARKAARAPLGA